MYDMKVKTPPMANKRRSWTDRLKDRFKSSAGGSAGLGDSSVQSCGPADDWTAAWVTHPHLQEGHHAPSVPSLQGSVFVAANFVYDYRQKYGLQDPGANGWMANPAVESTGPRSTGQRPEICIRRPGIRLSFFTGDLFTVSQIDGACTLHEGDGETRFRRLTLRGRTTHYYQSPCPSSTLLVAPLRSCTRLTDDPLCSIRNRRLGVRPTKKRRYLWWKRMTA